MSVFVANGLLSMSLTIACECRSSWLSVECCVACGIGDRYKGVMGVCGSVVFGRIDDRCVGVICVWVVGGTVV